MMQLAPASCMRVACVALCLCATDVILGGLPHCVLNTVWWSAAEEAVPADLMMQVWS